MLNPLFAFGVPAALMIAYMIFYFAKNLKNSDYRRFALTLIAVIKFITTVKRSFPSPLQKAFKKTLVTAKDV